MIIDSYKSIFFVWFLFFVISSECMLVKHINFFSRDHKRIEPFLSKKFFNSAIKDDKNLKKKQLFKDRIFHTITDNLYAPRDLQTWQIEVQGLIKQFPQEETAIYAYMQNLIEKTSMKDVISNDSSVVINLTKCALVPGFSVATCSAGVQSIWFTTACTLGHVGETVVEKAGYFFIGVPCAWSLTGVLAFFTHYLVGSIDFARENKQNVAAIRKDKNILILKKLLKDYQEQTKNNGENVE